MSNLIQRLSERRATPSVSGGPRSYDKKKRTADFVISTGAAVERSFGTEILRVSGVDISRMQSSGIPLLDSHQQTGINNHLGRFVNIRVERDAVVGTVQFNDTERGRQAEGMVARGEIKGISADYIVRPEDWEITDRNGRLLDADGIGYEDGLTFTARRWELLEASLVSVPADAAAQVRSFDAAPKHVGEARARMQARQRMYERMRSSASDDDDDELPAASPKPKQKSKARAPHDEGERHTPTTENRMNFHDARVLRDEREGELEAMTLALTERILSSRQGSAISYSPRAAKERMLVAQYGAQAGQYRGMGLVEMAARSINYRGRNNFLTQADAVKIFERAFNTTSDFPSIFQNALNKALLARYQLHQPTYREIAAERNFADFRPHPQVRAGDFPTLQPVLQTGELAYGSTTDNNEPISVNPYGVVFTISRTMLVNDDLGAIDQILGSAGDMVLVFENTTFYNMFKSNPLLNQDGNAVFSSAHNNLAASGADPSVATIAAGRTALREMTTISGNLINVPPSIILTGPQQETNADQMVASITPTLTTSVNPFSGRLRSVSDANITDNSWYLMADPARVPNFVYGFLAGSGGPRTRIFEPFGVQGVKVSLEHDFGCGAIDFRGGYKVPSH
jgi:phage head maturation protease